MELLGFLLLVLLLQGDVLTAVSAVSSDMHLTTIVISVVATDIVTVDRVTCTIGSDCSAVGFSSGNFSNKQVSATYSTVLLLADSTSIGNRTTSSVSKIVPGPVSTGSVFNVTINSYNHTDATSSAPEISINSVKHTSTTIAASLNSDQSTAPVSHLSTTTITTSTARELTVTVTTQLRNMTTSSGTIESMSLYSASYLTTSMGNSSLIGSPLTSLTLDTASTITSLFSIPTVSSVLSTSTTIVLVSFPTLSSVSVTITKTPTGDVSTSTLTEYSVTTTTPPSLYNAGANLRPLRLYFGIAEVLGLLI